MNVLVKKSAPPRFESKERLYGNGNIHKMGGGKSLPLILWELQNAPCTGEGYPAISMYVLVHRLRTQVVNLEVTYICMPIITLNNFLAFLNFT